MLVRVERVVTKSAALIPDASKLLPETEMLLSSSTSVVNPDALRRDKSPVFPIDISNIFMLLLKMPMVLEDWIDALLNLVKQYIKLYTKLTLCTSMLLLEMSNGANVSGEENVPGPDKTHINIVLHTDVIIADLKRAAIFNGCGVRRKRHQVPVPLDTRQ